MASIVNCKDERCNCLICRLREMISQNSQDEKEVYSVLVEAANGDHITLKKRQVKRSSLLVGVSGQIQIHPPTDLTLSPNVFSTALFIARSTASRSFDIFNSDSRCCHNYSPVVNVYHLISLQCEFPRDYISLGQSARIQTNFLY